MHLIYILVIIVSVLTVLSGLTLVFGSSKSEKSHSAWFLTAAIGEAIWGLSISIFLGLGNGSVQQEVAPWLVKGIYGGAILMDVALLGYISWRYKTGKLVTTLFAIIGLILLAVFAYDPTVLYSSINLSNMVLRCLRSIFLRNYTCVLRILDLPDTTRTKSKSKKRTSFLFGRLACGRWSFLDF